MAGDRVMSAPIGTLAPAFMGGAWCRVEHGWQWNGHLRSGAGGIYPRPGGDWDGRLIHPPASTPAPTLKSGEVRS